MYSLTKDEIEGEVILTKKGRTVLRLSIGEWSHLLANATVIKPEETDVEPRTDAEGVADGDTGGNDTVA